MHYTFAIERHFATSITSLRSIIKFYLHLRETKTFTFWMCTYINTLIYGFT